MWCRALRKRISETIARPLVILDANFRIIYASELFCRIFLIASGDAEGKSLFSFKDGILDIPSLKRQLQEIKSTDSIFQEYFIKHNFPDIGDKVLTVIAYPACLEGLRDNIVLLLSVDGVPDSKDITISLHGSEDLSSTILTFSPNPIVLINPDTSIKYANTAFEELTGFSLAELIGQKAPYPWWTEETISKTRVDFEYAFERGARKLEEFFRKKSGETFWVEITSLPLKKDGKLQYYLACWVDITHRKRFENNMELYISRVTQIQEDEHKRLAGEVHDLAIQSLASLALEIDSISRGKKHSEKEAIAHLQDVRLRINSIIDDLRNFCHRLHPGVIDEIGLVAALEMLIEDMSKGDLEANLNVVGEPWRLPPQSEVALFRLTQQALQNTKEHSGATQAIVRLRFTADKIRLSIADNGKGFNLPDMLVDFAAQRKLGLINMKLQASFLNSELRIRSRLNRGTVITINVAGPGISPAPPSP